MDYALSHGADPVRLDRHAAAPTDQGNEDRDHPQRVQEPAWVEREVSEVPNRSVALEVRGRRMSHLMNRDRHQQSGHEQKRRQNESDEQAHSMGILPTRLGDRRREVRCDEAVARLVRAGGVVATRCS